MLLHAVGPLEGIECQSSLRMFGNQILGKKVFDFHKIVKKLRMFDNCKFLEFAPTKILNF